MLPEMAKLLQVPVPPLAAVLVPQAAPDLVAGDGPGYLAVLLLGGWIVLWFLDRIGKLPGRESGERRSAAFTPADRATIDELAGLVRVNAERNRKLYDLLAYRDDVDGVERFLKYLQEARKAHTMQAEILATLQKIRAELAKRGTP